MFEIEPNFRWKLTQGPSIVWTSHWRISTARLFSSQKLFQSAVGWKTVILVVWTGKFQKTMRKRQKLCHQWKDSLNWTLWKKFSSSLLATFIQRDPDCQRPAASSASIAYVTTGGLNGNYISSSDTGTLAAHTPEKWTWQRLPQFQEWEEEEEKEFLTSHPPLVPHFWRQTFN